MPVQPIDDGDSDEALIGTQTPDGLTYYDPGHESSPDEDVLIENQLNLQTAQQMALRNRRQPQQQRLRRTTSSTTEEDHENEEGQIGPEHDTDRLQRHFRNEQNTTAAAAGSDNNDELAVNDLVWPVPPPTDAIKRYKLTARDVELLRLVTDAADRRIRANNQSNATNVQIQMPGTRSNSSVTSPLSKDDFAELFQTFKAFTTRNGLNPRSSPTYFQCLNIIVHLCSYEHQSTWRERLDQLLQDYSVEMAKRVKKDDLERRFSTYQLQIKSHVFERWFNKYAQQSMYDRNLISIAVTRDRHLLKRDSFRLWLYSFEVAQWRTTTAILHYDKFLIFSSFKKLYNKSRTVREDERFARIFVLAKCLKKWRNKYSQITQDWKLRAIALDEFKLKQRVFVEWEYKLYEEVVHSRANGALVSGVFNEWRGMISGISQALDYAETNIYNMNIAHKALRQWLSQKKFRDEEISLAVSIHEENLRISSLDEWRNRTGLNSLLTPLLDVSDNKLKSKTFQLWHTHSLQSLEATRFRNFMQCHQIFRQWRLKTGCFVISRGINDKIVNERFHHWLLSERLELMIRYRNGILTMKILKKWYARSLQSERKNWALTQEAARYSTDRRRMTVFHMWASKLTDCQANERDALNLDRNRLIRKHFSSFMNSVYVVAYMYRVACKMHDKVTLKQALNYWRVSAYHRKMDRLAQLYRAYVKKVVVQRKRLVVDVWLSRHDLNLDNERVALELKNNRDRALAFNAFQIWMKRKLAVTADYDRACYIAENDDVSSMFSRWVDRSKTVTANIEEANFIAEIKVLDSQEAMFRTWRMKSFRITSRMREADEFYSRLQVSRFRRIWRLWRAKAKDSKVMAEMDQSEANGGDVTSVKTAPRRTAVGLGSFTGRAGRLTALTDKPRTSHANTVSHLAISDATVPSSVDQSYLQTPTRVRSKKYIPLTSVDRWRKIKGITAAASGSQLRNEVFLHDDINDNENDS